MLTWTGVGTNADNNGSTVNSWDYEDYDWNGNGDLGIIHSGNGKNIIKFTGSAPPNKTAVVTFNTLALGGIAVDAGSDLYSITGSDRDVLWRASYDADNEDIGGVNGKTNFVIGSDFNFGTSSARWRAWVYTADANFAISNEKTFSIYAKSMDYVGTLTGSTGLTEPSTPFTQTVTGGGTLDLNLTDYNLSRGASWVITGGSTLDLSSIQASATATFGSLELSGGAKINMGTNGSTLRSTMTLGSGGGTIIGENVTLAGSMDLSGDSSLTLDGSFTFDLDLVIDLGVTSFVDGQSYELFSRADDATAVNFTLADLNFVGLDDVLRIGSLDWVNNILTLTIAESPPQDLTHSSGDIIWGADNAWSDSSSSSSSFVDGDRVTIGGSDSSGGTVTIADAVSPFSITFTGDGEWILDQNSALGAITGESSLLKEGSGSLTINMSNSYEGNTTVTGGTLTLAAASATGTGNINLAGESAVLEIGHAEALAEGVLINYTSGTIKYGAGITTSLHDKINVTEGSQLKLDLNNNNVSWGGSITGSFTITDTSTATSESDIGGIFTYNHSLGSNTATISGRAILSTNNSSSGINIAGDGTLRILNTDDYNVGNITGFTGTFEATRGDLIVIFTKWNTENDRFDLVTETDSAQATHIEAIVLGNNDWGGKTLFINNLSGYSDISVTNGTNAHNRSLNILMTEDNFYHGNFVEKGDDRWDTITIGSTTPTDPDVEGYIFNWSGETYDSSGYGNIHANLLIKNGATMNFTTNGSSGGQWADTIAIEEGGRLLVSRTDGNGFVQSASDNVISGAGTVEVTGKATFDGSNTYTGDTVVNGSSAVLTVNTDTAIDGTADTKSTIQLMNGGTLKLIAGNAESSNITVNASGKISAASSEDAITLSGDISGSTTSTFSVSDISAAEANVAFAAGSYTVTGSVSNVNISALTDATLNFSGATLKGVTYAEGVTATLNDARIKPTTYSLNTSGTLTTTQLGGGGTIENTGVSIYTLGGVADSLIGQTVTGTLTINLSDFTDVDFGAIFDAPEGKIAGIEIDGMNQAQWDALNLYYGDVVITDGTDSIKVLGVTYINGGVTGNLVFVVPEPSTVALSLLALGGLVARRRRQPAEVA